MTADALSHPDEWLPGDPEPQPKPGSYESRIDGEIGSLSVRVEGRRAFIERADPIIRMSGQFVRARLGIEEPSPPVSPLPWFATVDTPPDFPEWPGAKTDVQYPQGRILTIRGSDGAKVFYVLGDYDAEHDSYIAKWPD